MTIKSHWRGHNIEFLKDEWVYSDTKELVSDTHNDRACSYCDLPATKEGHDGCLGTLEDVRNACCGHGVTKEVYVQFTDGSSVRGEDAMVVLKQKCLEGSKDR